MRVAGNDSGEKLSILSGILSRLDRDAPEYVGSYRDFNINYFLVNLAATGGSSGSPIFDVDGDAVALMCGGGSKTTNFVLPLDLPMKALVCLENGHPLIRGDIQVLFSQMPIQRCLELGLPEATVTEIQARHPETNHLLVATRVLPSSPAYQKISEGDIVVQVGDNYVTHLLSLGDVFDKSVGEDVRFRLHRGSSMITADVPVQDLYRLIPDRLVYLWGSIFHNVSYHQAMTHNLPVSGVCCTAHTGSFSIFPGDIVVSLDGEPIPDIDTLVATVKRISGKSNFNIGFTRFELPGRNFYDIIHVSNKYFPDLVEMKLNGKTREWDKSISPLMPESCSPRAELSQDAAISDTASSPRLVRVEVSLLKGVNGCTIEAYEGWAIVLGSGLAVIGREAVPHMFCEVTVLVGLTRTPAEIKFLHPRHGYAIIGYGSHPGHNAELSDVHAQRGDVLNFIGYNGIGEIIESTVTVAQIRATVPERRILAPAYTLTNCEELVVSSVQPFKKCNHGVFLGRNDQIQALWLSYNGHKSATAICASELWPAVKLIQGEMRSMKDLGVEFSRMPLIKASDSGVSQERVSDAQKAAQTHLFTVKFTTAGNEGDGASRLQEGDIILELEGKWFPSRQSLANISEDVVTATIVRAAREMQIRFASVDMSATETNHVINYEGAILQKPPLAVREQVSELPSEVYVPYVSPGSLAEHWVLPESVFITHFNDQPLKSLNDFTRYVKGLPPGGTFLYIYYSSRLTQHRIHRNHSEAKRLRIKAVHEE